MKSPLTQKFFAHRRIADDTASYVPGLNLDKARFNLANEGFTYRDCFVLCPSVKSNFERACWFCSKRTSATRSQYHALLVGLTRSKGYSYPMLGVRSWECRNLLCPDRSKYGRGKRYSFKSLLMPITHSENTIPASLVKAWSRDVQIGREPWEVIEMLVRFYSLRGDSIRFTGFGVEEPSLLYGRRARWDKIEYSGQQNPGNSFFDSAWFHRYVVNHENPEKFKPLRNRSFQLVHGDARTALCSFDDNYFDGAVTSPPYYNAREYAQWPNIYCYLYDMLGVIKECYRF